MRTQQKSFCLLLLISLLILFPIFAVHAQGENPENAITISLGPTNGDLPGPAADGSIWYVLTLTTAGDYQFSLTGPEGTDFDYDLFDSSLTFIEGGYHDAYPDSFFVLDLRAGMYYVNVYAISGTGAFTLNIITYTRVPGDNYDNPIRISLGNTSGNIPGPGISGEIYYIISLSAGDYQFLLTGSEGTNFDLFLFDNNGNSIGTADGTTYPDILVITDIRTGNYLVVIIPITGTGAFTLNIATYIPPTGASSDDPILITLGETVGDMPGPGISGEIWYTITLTTGGIKFSLTGQDETNFDLEFYDSDLNFIGSAVDTIYPDTLIILDLEAASYFIVIRPITGTGDFTLTITVPGRSIYSPMEIRLGDTVGNLPGPGLYGEIWYVISLLTDDYQFSFTGSDGTNFSFYLYDTFTNPISGAWGEDYPKRLVIQLKAGSYYIVVYGINGTGTGTFNLSITNYTPTPEPPETLILIELGDTTGSLPGPATDGSIWYNISLLAGDYQCSLIGFEGTDFNLELYDSNFTFVSGAHSTGYPDVLTVLDLETGIYYIKIMSNDGTGTFTLTISKYIPPTTDTSTTITTTTSSKTAIWLSTPFIFLILSTIIIFRQKR